MNERQTSICGFYEQGRGRGRQAAVQHSFVVRAGLSMRVSRTVFLQNGKGLLRQAAAWATAGEIQARQQTALCCERLLNVLNYFAFVINKNTHLLLLHLTIFLKQFWAPYNSSSLKKYSNCWRKIEKSLHCVEQPVTVKLEKYKNAEYPWQLNKKTKDTLLYLYILSSTGTFYGGAFKEIFQLKAFIAAQWYRTVTVLFC